MPKDPTNSSAIFASNLLNGQGNARTLNGFTSDDFVKNNEDAIPLADNTINLGDSTYRYKDLWTLAINGIQSDLFARKNASIIPTLDNTFSLGDGTHKYKYIFGTEIRTTKIIAEQVLTSDNKAYSHTKLADIGSNTHAQIDAHISAMKLVHGATDANVPERIVARDKNGAFSAGTIKAKLGDLAEKYTAEITAAPVGTVYCVSKNDQYEVEICREQNCLTVIGVVSQNPGLILSTEVHGVLLGIKGKVPIRVVGCVKKGDMLAANSTGCAYVTDNPLYKFAIALENSDVKDEKLIRAVL